MTLEERQAYLAAAKQRSLELLGAGDLPNAVAEMFVAIGKVPELRDNPAFALTAEMSLASSPDSPEGIRRWLDSLA